MQLALFPGVEEGEERVPGTHYLRMGLITTEFRATVFIRNNGDITNLLHWCASSCAVGVLFKWVLYPAVLCRLVAGYLKIQLKKEQVASIDQGNMRAFLWLSTNFGKTFLFVHNNIKLARACSSDVYSVLRTKAEIILWRFTWTVDRHNSIVVLLILLHGLWPHSEAPMPGNANVEVVQAWRAWYFFSREKQ